MPKPLLAVLQNSLGLEKKKETNGGIQIKYEGSPKRGGNGYTCGDIGEVTARHGKRNEKNLLPFCLKKSCSGHHVALHRFNSSVRTTRSKHIDCCVVSCVRVSTTNVASRSDL